MSRQSPLIQGMGYNVGGFSPSPGYLKTKKIAK
jgi:hypothetical protein